ncbi:MAG: 5-deoxy-glucuronate isomerase [Terriglobales bacterium]
MVALLNHARDKGQESSVYRHPEVPIRLTHRRYQAGKSFSVGSPRAEQVLTLLSGELQVSGPVSAVLARRSVFEGPPVAVYVGRGQKVTVLGKKVGELVIVECAAQEPGPVRIVRAACQEERGKEGFRRTVYNLIDEQFPAERLLVGETFNQPGNWSSFPPHKHDRVARGERRLQEVYFFKVLPKAGFGLMHLYDYRGLDETHTVRNNDVVWIPRGYHPVSAMPGHRLYYLWALAGDGRKLKWNTDPQFRWLL